jgi:putative ABC transport system permease protein
MTITLTYVDLVVASLLILVNGAISLYFRLGLERTLLVNALRMAVQLSLIGVVLKFIFAQTTPLWTALMILVMVSFAGHEVMARQSRKLRGWWGYGIGTTTILFVGLTTTLVAMLAIIGPHPWYAPRYVLPILGMILGNTMSGVSLGMETLTTALSRDRVAVEARIALGHTRLQAVGEPLRHSLRTGMMPIVNAMAASGIVSLPGMMTGQILAGNDPVEATKYQIMIMFLIAGATALGTLVATMGITLRLTDERGRLRLDRLG